MVGHPPSIALIRSVQVMSIRILASIGLISYPIYLVHFLAIEYLSKFLLNNFDRHGLLYVLPWLLPAVALALSWGYFQLVEKRFLFAPDKT